MKWLLVVAALAIGGCEIISTPVGRLVERDLTSAIAMAKSHGTELEVACFDAMKKAVAKIREISDLDSDGVIASTYKAWLLNHYRAQFRAQVMQFCAPVAAGMGANLMIR